MNAEDQINHKRKPRFNSKTAKERDPSIIMNFLTQINIIQNSKQTKKKNKRHSSNNTNLYFGDKSYQHRNKSSYSSK